VSGWTIAQGPCVETAVSYIRRIDRTARASPRRAVLYAATNGQMGVINPNPSLGHVDRDQNDNTRSSPAISTLRAILKLHAQ